MRLLLVALQLTTALAVKVDRISSSIAAIEAVVCEGHGARDVAWIEGHMPIHRLTDPGSRQLGESRPWLHWLVENYHHLPDYVFFSHGDQNSWHAHHSIDAIMALPAEPCTMLSECTWIDDTGMFENELPYLELLYSALFGVPWQRAWAEFDMRHHRCCTESVVSSTAIRSISQEVYEELVHTIDRFPQAPWGWVVERTWQNLFTRPAREPNDVIRELRSGAARLKESLAEKPSFLQQRAWNEEERANNDTSGRMDRRRIRCGTVKGY